MIMKIVIEIEYLIKAAAEMRAAMQMESCEVASKINYVCICIVCVYTYIHTYIRQASYERKPVLALPCPILK